MEIMWLPAIGTSLIALAFILLWRRWQTGYTLALIVLVGAGIYFGWHIHGGLTENQAMNYYYAGEANGYNRGYASGLMQRTGNADNSTLQQIIPFLFDFRDMDDMYH